MLKETSQKPAIQRPTLRPAPGDFDAKAEVVVGVAGKQRGVLGGACRARRRRGRAGRLRARPSSPPNSSARRCLPWIAVCARFALRQRGQPQGRPQRHAAQRQQQQHLRDGPVVEVTGTLPACLLHGLLHAPAPQREAWADMRRWAHCQKHAPSGGRYQKSMHTQLSITGPRSEGD